MNNTITVEIPELVGGLCNEDCPFAFEPCILGYDDSRVDIEVIFGYTHQIRKYFPVDPRCPRAK